jgi:uncharacterized protein (DUF1778 family)
MSAQQDQSRLVLSVEQWEAFLASLKRPSRYKPEVARLLATKLPDED